MRKTCLKYILVLCTIFLGPFTSRLGAANPDKGLRNVTLQLKWKHQFQFAGYYAAIEKGYFQEVGLNVNLAEAVENQDPNEAVFNGSAQFGITNSEILMLRSQHKGAVVLASILQHSPLVLLTLEKSGIEQAKDLVGKRVALEKNSNEILAYLNSEGVTRDKLILRPRTYDIDQLINKEVDAISAYSTDETFELEIKGIGYIIISPLMGGFDFYGDVLFTSADLIKSDPVMVASFLKAALKGWKYALSHQDEIIGLIYEKYTQRNSKVFLKHEANHVKSLIMNDVIEFGYTSPDRWQHILEIYQDLNLIDKSETINGLLYSDYVGRDHSVSWKLVLVLCSVIVLVSSATYFFYRTSKCMGAEIKTRIKAQKELGESESLYRSVLTASPDTIIITDFHGIILFASQMVTKMFGYGEAEVLHKNIFNYLDDNDHHKAQAAIKRMFEGSFAGAEEYKGIKSDGSRFDIELNGEFIRGPEGQPVSMVYVARDISDRKISEEKLRKSEETYQILVETINEVIYEISNEGTINYVSPAIERVLGYKPDELVATNIFEYLYPEDRQLVLKRLSSLEERNYSYYEYRFVNKSKKIRWVRSSTTAILQNGILIGGAGSLTDITEQKMAEEKILKANRFYSFVSHINEKILHFRDKNQLFYQVCHVAIEFGKFRMAWIGMLDGQTKIVEPVAMDGFEDGYLSVINQITINDEPEGYGPTGSALREGKCFMCEDIENDTTMALWKDAALQRGYRSSIALPIRQSGGTNGVFTLYSSLPNFFDEEEKKLLGEVAENISFALDNIENEKEKNDLYTNLELKVNERTAQLAITNENLLNEIEERKKAEIEISKARVEAELANRAKSEFLSRMSHELRTPMNSILGFAQLMEMGDPNQKQKKGIAHILRSGRHLLDLINEVLDISRIESGMLSLSMEPVRLSGAILEMIDTLKPIANERNIKIELVGSPVNQLFVKADRQRVKQVLLNLISNAVKYNRTGGSVWIKTELAQKAIDGVAPIRVTVTDNGPGITPVNIVKLFSPFERIGAEQTETEGSGLGLVVVKKLIEAMGGKVGLDSKPNEGSSFWFELPNCECQAETTKKLGGGEYFQSGEVQKSGTILYIEDNAPNIELVEQILSAHRPNIKLVANAYGKGAVRLALEHSPFLILLDLNLPDIHGSEVLDLLRSEEKTKSVPVVVISADAMPNQIKRLLEDGARDYLTKPIDVSCLLKAIDKYLEGKI